MSRPPTRTAPGATSCMRSTASTSVVLPAPVRPTIASVAPAGSVNDTPSSSRRPSAAMVRSRTSIDGVVRRRARGLADPALHRCASAIAGFVSSSSRTRAQAAMPRCQMPMIQPSAKVGHDSSTR